MSCDTTRRGGYRTGDCFKERTFTRAIGPDDANPLALSYLKRNIAQGPEQVVADATQEQLFQEVCGLALHFVRH